MKNKSKLSLNVKEIRKDFPIFVNNPRLIYLDNAATSQKPKQVVESLINFYEKENANAGRGLYELSEKATNHYENARCVVANFINSKKNEIIFTKNATESLNLLAFSLKPILEKMKEQGKDEIILSIMEHHSNLLPWQRLSKELNLKLRFIPITKNYALDYNEAEKLITKKTALVSICHISNVLGTINDIEKIIRLAKKNNALTIIDAAQSISHIKIDVKSLDCDFLVFSGHKMLGPTGTGVLYGKEHLLNEMSPFLLGGGIVKDVSTANFVLKDAPEKYEAGTQDYAGAIAFSEAIDYINKLGFENIKEHESELTNYLLKELKYISGIEVYHTNNLNESSGIVSFNIKGIHCHDIASLLNDYNICVRAGHNCAIPLMKSLNIDGCVRVSLAFYNTKEDVDNLISALNKILEFWNIKEENYGK